MLLVMITLICIFYILTDLIPIYKNKLWGLFWVYSAMMVFVYVLAIFITWDTKLPSPAIPLKNAVTTIFGVNPE